MRFVITKAQRIAAAFDYGAVDSCESRTLREACEAAGGRYKVFGARRCWVFDDGSAIIMSGKIWDVALVPREYLG